jgi:hypothetical protein
VRESPLRPSLTLRLDHERQHRASLLRCKIVPSAPLLSFMRFYLSLQFSFALSALAQQPSPLPDARPIPHMQVLPLPNHEASFQLDGRELTRAHFDPHLKRPFWYPVQTTLAPSLIRMGHPHDPVSHRHHYGLWITHAAVSGVNFWDDEPDNGKDRVRGSIVHQQTLGFWDGDEAASMMTLNHWIADRDKRIILKERRHTEVRPMPDAKSWLMIVDCEFSVPKGQTATFEPSGFGLLSVRMAKSIGVIDGGGRIMNSEGLINEVGVFRKPTKWCDYSGRLTPEAFAGITLMNHPKNPQHPTAFHVRNDGWMCSCLSLEKPVEVTQAAPLHVRWALWMHEGVPDQARCEEVWQRFAEMPLPDMDKKR